MSPIAVIVLIVGFALSLLFTLNAVLSFAEHRRTDLSWFRAEVAAFAWVAAVILCALTDRVAS